MPQKLRFYNIHKASAAFKGRQARGTMRTCQASVGGGGLFKYVPLLQHPPCGSTHSRQTSDFMQRRSRRALKTNRGPDSSLSGLGKEGRTKKDKDKASQELGNAEDLHRPCSPGPSRRSCSPEQRTNIRVSPVEYTSTLDRARGVQVHDLFGALLRWSEDP